MDVVVVAHAATGNGDGAAQGQQGDHMSIVTLPHPASGQAAVFLSSGVDLFEVNAVDQTPSSWILQDDVVSCRPTLLMATRIDPLLIALPLLQRGRQHSRSLFVPADQIVSDDDAGSLCALQSHAHCDLSVLCDSGPQGTLRLHDDKVAAWLARKVDRLRPSLPSLVDAVGLVCDYVDAFWHDAVLKRYDLPVDTLLRHGRPAAPASSSADPVTVSGDVDTSKPTAGTRSKVAGKPAKSIGKRSRAAQNLAKVDTSSMRSLRSYFGSR